MYLNYLNSKEATNRRSRHVDTNLQMSGQRIRQLTENKAVNSYLMEYIQVKSGQSVKVRESNDQESIKSDPNSPPSNPKEKEEHSKN